MKEVRLWLVTIGLTDMAEAVFIISLCYSKDLKMTKQKIFDLIVTCFTIYIN